MINVKSLNLKNKIYVDAPFSKKENALIKKEVLEKLDNSTTSLQEAEYILYVDTFQVEMPSSDLSGVAFIKRNQFSIKYVLFEITEKTTENILKIQDIIDGEKEPFEYKHQEIGVRFSGIGLNRNRIDRIMQRKIYNEIASQEAIEGKYNALSFLEPIQKGTFFYRNIKPINLYNMESMHMDDIETFENFAIKSADAIFSDIITGISHNEELKIKRQERKLKKENKKINNINNNTKIDKNKKNNITNDDANANKNNIENEDDEDDIDEDDYMKYSEDEIKLKKKVKKDKSFSIEYERYKQKMKQKNQGIIEDIIDFAQETMEEKKTKNTTEEKKENTIKDNKIEKDKNLTKNPK